MTVSHKFPRESRLKLGRDFERVKRQGKRLARGSLIANWLPVAGTARLGVITSRRIGNAVARARARRLLREAYRQHQHRLNETVDLVLVARASIAGTPFQEVERDFLRALQQGGLLRDE